MIILPTPVHETYRAVITDDRAMFGALCVNQFAFGGANIAWPTANLAFYHPFFIDRPITVSAIAHRVGTPSGNFDIGIFDGQSLAKLASSGSTAGSGSAAFVETAVSVSLPAGCYLIGMSWDNTTTTMLRNNNNANQINAWGFRQEASAFPLPATATPAVITASYPAIYFYVKTTNYL